MNPNMRSDMISLNSGCAALIPLTCQVQVVSALAPNMFLANVFIESLGSIKFLETVIPAADKGFLRSRGTRL